MTYDTHVYLGELLYPVICEIWGMPLSRKRFMHGCVKPDVSSLFFRHPHFYRISKKFIFRKIKQLTKKRLHGEKKNKKISEDLGIILHYIADFFTSVHNLVPNKLQEHMAFEKQLRSDFSTGVTKDMIREYFVNCRDFSSSPADIKEHLMRLHKANRCRTGSTRYDIHEILTACAGAAAGIMNALTADALAVSALPYPSDSAVRENSYLEILSR